MGRRVNRAWTNGIAAVFLVIMVVVSVVTVPLLLATKAGQ